MSIALGILAPACSKDVAKESTDPVVRDLASPPKEQPTAAAPDVGTEPTVEQFGPILNVMGRQRMLTQKMAKEVLLVAADIDATANRKNAADSLALFQKSLAGLRSGDESLRLPPGHYGKVNTRLDKLGTSFKPFEAIVAKTAQGDRPSKEALTQLSDLTDSLLEQEEAIMSILSGQAGAVLRKAVADGTAAKVPMNVNLTLDVSGRQRMFSQKLAKDLLFVHLKIDAERHRSELKKTASLFEKVNAGLRHGDKDIGIGGTSDTEIVKQLDAVDGIWVQYNDVIERTSQPNRELSRAEAERIAKLNPMLLTEANKVVELYDRAASGTSAPTSAGPTAKK